MSVDVLIAVAGTIVTFLVVAGMFLITPSNLERSSSATVAVAEQEAEPVTQQVRQEH